MEGVIARCFEELVLERFGRATWERILKQSGMEADTTFAGRSKVPDESVVRVVRSTCDVTGLTPVQVSEAFKDYWVRVFAPRLYMAYYSSPGEMLRGQSPLDDIPTVLH